jgi:predicted Zn-dependent protease
MIAAVIALIAIGGYFMKSSVNPVTGQKQRVSLSVDQEIALGLQSAPEMARQFGGLARDPNGQGLVDLVGQKLVAVIPKATEVYPFEFHVLADEKTVNAFALPGGQIFITKALLDRLETEGQLAGVLGHEIGHVIERHSAQHMAKAELTQGLTGAVAVGVSDPGTASSRMATMAAAYVGQMVNLKYGRDDELESDRHGLEFMAKAGYDPRSMVRVMEILREASGGASQPEWMSSHPDPGNRIEKINETIQALFPEGVPAGLTQ